MITNTDNSVLVPAAVTEIATRPNADTYNWDTVVSLHFDTTNTAITNTWSSADERVKKIDQAASDDPSYSISAALGPWQLTPGGDGKNVNMVVPVVSGTYHAGAKSYPLDGLGTKVVIQINMDWIPDPKQKSFVINSDVSTIKTDLSSGKIDSTLIADFAANGVKITESSPLSSVTPDAAWLIGSDDGKFYYLFYSQDKDQDQFITVYEYAQSFKNNLQVLSKEAGGTAAVVIMNVVNPPNAGSIGNAVLPELLSSWFNSNISYFNFVFSVIDLSPQLAQSPNYSWIDPTDTSYAVVDEQTLQKSLMGVLTMIQNNTPGTNHQVSPNAIPSGDDAKGANVGFLISGPNFLKNMMLGGVKHLFDSAKDSDFTIFNDGLSIKNINELTWGYFKMDDNASASAKDNNYTSQLDKGVLPQELVNAVWNEGEGIYISGYSVKVNEAGSQWFMSKGGSDTEYIVDLEGGVINFYKATKVTIAANQFEMNLINSLLEIKFIDLTYHQSWEYDVHINYTEQVNLGLKTVTTSTGASKQIFNFTQSVRDMTVNVTKTQAAITFDIVMGAVTAALALIAVIGPVIDGLSAAAEGTVEVTEAAGSAAIRGEQFASELGGSAEREASNVENETNALSNAARQTGGRMTSIKNAFNATRWKVFGGITAFVGAVYGVDMAISAIMEAMTKSEWEKVPGFDEFANAAIAPYAFPGVTGYDLTSAWLAGSLQIGLKAK